MSNKNKRISNNRYIFAQKLYNLRKDKGLSQRQLAEKLDFSAHAQISRLENAVGDPTIETLRRLAEFFEVDLHWLIMDRYSLDFVEFFNILKPAIEKHLRSLREQIEKTVSDISSLEFQMNFDGIDNETEIIQKEKLAAQIQNEYDKILEIINRIKGNFGP